MNDNISKALYANEEAITLLKIAMKEVSNEDVIILMEIIKSSIEISKKLSKARFVINKRSES